MARPQRHEHRHQRRVGRRRTVRRSPRLIRQATGPRGVEPVHPLVAGLTADLIVGTQLSHRPAVPLPIGYETHAKIHGRHSLPRHG
jgi:hypothetical protein